MSIRDVIVNLQWDGWTDRLLMPLDYLRLSMRERMAIPLEQLKVFAPREMFMVPDWGFERLFSATMLPGFNPSRCLSGVGVGFRVKSIIFLTKTVLPNWQVIDDWNNEDNMVECLGTGASGSAGGNGTAGNMTSSGNAGNGGRGGGGGAYAMKRNMVFSPDGAGVMPEVAAIINNYYTAFWDGGVLSARSASDRLGGNADESFGDVKWSGGDGGTGGQGGDGLRTLDKYQFQEVWGGGGGGAGAGGGAAGPEGAGAKGFNGGNGIDGNAGNTGNGGGVSSGGDGGPPRGSNGGSGSNNGGAGGSTWNDAHATGGGGGGGAGGIGGVWKQFTGNPGNGANGKVGGAGGNYGGGGGGSGGGGGCGGASVPGKAGGNGLIVIQNNLLTLPSASMVGTLMNREA